MGHIEVGTRLDRIEAPLDRIEDRLDRLDTRVGRPETEVAVIKWMLGFTLAINVAVLFFIRQIMLRLPG